MSQNVAYGSFADLVDDIAHALKEIAAELRKAGYGYVQFDEPSLCENGRTKNELQMAQHAFEVCAKGMGVKTSLQTYFGDAGPVIRSPPELSSRLRWSGLLRHFHGCAA